jgi:hypothetical protein
MPAKDTYHDALRNSLVKDGWTITDDPLHIVWAKKDFFIDLGAERMLAAEKGGRRIAVEVKSFMGASAVNDLEKALGQFLLYQSILRRSDPDRALFLALPKGAAEVFDEPLGQALLEDYEVKVIIFDPKKEEITRWIP